MTITFVIMLLIFWQSQLPARVSAKESGRLVEFILRFIPGNKAVLTFWVRKTAHFSEYLILGASLDFTVRDYIPHRGKAILPAWAVGTLYAVTDELHQIVVSGRSCELRDMAIDSCGVIVGVLLVTLIFRGKKTDQ